MKVTDGFVRSRDLNRGNPTGRPLRVPFFEDRKLSSPAAAAVTPDWKACFETSFHHGATSSLAAFQAFDWEKADQDCDGVRASSDSPAARSSLRVLRLSLT